MDPTEHKAISTSGTKVKTQTSKFCVSYGCV